MNSVSPSNDEAEKKEEKKEGEIKGDIVAPPQEKFEPPKNQKQPDFASVPRLSEEDARDALLDYISQQCCCWFSKEAARSLTFSGIKQSTSYHYVLETFTEERRKCLDYTGYRGGPIDGPENGPPPEPWDIDLPEKAEMFEDKTREWMIPHTAYVKDCHHCGARGETTCAFCKGSGKSECRGGCSGKGVKKVNKNSMWVEERCGTCRGTGEVNCSSCNGRGIRTCFHCGGHRKLRWFVKLLVLWRCNKADHVVGKAELPPELVGQATGSLAFQDEQIRVLPLKTFPEAGVNTASQKLLQENKFPNKRILMQRHMIRVVPVTECHCKYQEKGMVYYVYGLDNKVHAPDYPQRCTLLRDCGNWCGENILDDIKEECACSIL